MAKSRSGYKRPYLNQAPEGVKIEVTEATYQRLKTAARANRCTIGQYVETNLRHYLKLGMNVPKPKIVAAAVPAKTAKPRSFQISEATFDDIERFAETKGRTAKTWIAVTVLSCLGIELERLRGEQIEGEWRERHRM